MLEREKFAIIIFISAENDWINENYLILNLTATQGMAKPEDCVNPMPMNGSGSTHFIALVGQLLNSPPRSLVWNMFSANSAI